MLDTISKNWHPILLGLIISILAILTIRLCVWDYGSMMLETFSDNKPRSRKIAFLFLVRSNLLRPDIWQRYLAGHESRYSIYCHAKEPDNVTDPLLKDRQIPEHIETCWGCPNLVEANLLLMKEALKDENNYKFILASESCAPLIPFQTMYSVLTACDNSHIGIHKDNNSREDRYHLIKNPPFNSNDFIKHSGSGLVMNRHHAQLLVDTLESFQRDWNKTTTPDEHYIGNILLHLDGDFATKEIKNNDNKKTTFDIWQVSDLNGKANLNEDFMTDEYINLKKVTNKGIDAARDAGFLFVRKVGEDTEIDVGHLLAFIGI